MFEHGVDFDEHELGGDVRFSRATFRGPARFIGTRFGGRAEFDRAACADEVWLAETKVEGGATFARATFARSAPRFDVSAEGALAMAHAVFHEPAAIEAGARSLACDGVRFLGGARVNARVSTVSLADTAFEKPCTLAGGHNSRAWRETWQESVAPSPLHPLRIAAIYRALRKGREEAKDEPGAADFYHGEMEMRRHGSDSRAERAILFLYWLVSGYGLRASRALAALAVTVVAFAFLFDAWGFQRDESLGTALLFSVESTTSLLRGTDRELTGLGETLWIALRLLGPLFFGLGILSLRGRVKR